MSEEMSNLPGLGGGGGGTNAITDKATTKSLGKRGKDIGNLLARPFRKGKPDPRSQFATDINLGLQGGGLVQGFQGGGEVGFFKGMGNIMGGKKWSGESRAQIGRSLSKSSNITPPTNTTKVTVINQPGTEQVDASEAQLPPAGNREIPSFDATSIRSSHKMEVLGISV